MLATAASVSCSDEAHDLSPTSRRLGIACSAVDLTDAPGSGACPGVDSLRVTAKSKPDGPKDYIRDAKLAWKDVGTNGLIAACEYSAGWADQWRLFFSFHQQVPRVEILFVYDTDFGCFVGELSNDSVATAHRHEDRICFDLSVEFFGSNGPQHLAGSLGLK
jgi:hypothetical protein